MNEVTLSFSIMHVHVQRSLLYVVSSCFLENGTTLSRWPDAVGKFIKQGTHSSMTTKSFVAANGSDHTHQVTLYLESNLLTDKNGCSVLLASHLQNVDESLHN